ncbi:MAG: hypothetical protein Q7R97_04125 [Candidatus Daviesbacteria bacterium]|nr:hypothetical protein [Candidatus Daviesbacteria bacterium]
MITIIEGDIERKYFPIGSEISSTKLEFYPLSKIPAEDIGNRFDDARLYRIALSLNIIKKANPQISFKDLEKLTNHERSFLVRKIFGIPGFQASTINSEHFCFRYLPQLQTLITHPNIHLKGRYTDRTPSIQKFSDLVDNYSISDWKKVTQNISDYFSLNTRTVKITATQTYETDDNYEPGFIALMKGMGDSVLADLIALDLDSERNLKYGWIWGNELSILPHAAKAVMMEIYQHGLGIAPRFLSMFLNSEQKPLSMGWLYQNPYKPQDQPAQIILSVLNKQVSTPITHPKPSLIHWL